MMTTHELPIRVYYEDTDFSGRVYHASFLRFLERGRTEWLRALGFEHSSISSRDGLVFAVRNLSIEYLKPALMDDALRVVTSYKGSKGAVIDFDQRIYRSDSLIVQATVRVVSLRRDRPVRPPRELLERLSASPSGGAS